MQGASLHTRSETRCAFLAGFPNTSVGVFATLPLHNGVFQENTVEASFDDSGQLESLKFKGEAQAEKASSAFSDVSESLAKLPKVVDDARKEAAEAKTTAVDTQSKYLKALKDRVQAENDLRNIGKLDAMGAETEELEALIKLLDARKRKAEALRALEEAR